jgi:hypothetical protein
LAVPIPDFEIKVPESELVISKADGAARQIDAAIEALQKGDFDIAITLAGAAEDMIGTDGLFHILQKSPRRKELGLIEAEWKIWNNERNWLKHQINEPPALHLTWFPAAIMIVRAASKLEEWSPLMAAFKEWFMRAPWPVTSAGEVVTTADVRPDDAG